MGVPYTENLTQMFTIAADGIHAASQSAAEKLTSAVDLQKFRRVVFVIDLGVLGASGTVDFQVKGSATSGGTYTAITGTAITQRTQAGSDGTQYILVEVRNESVQALNLGYKFLKGSLLPGTAASLAAVVVLGVTGGHEPGSAGAAAALVQTVVK